MNLPASALLPLALAAPVLGQVVYDAGTPATVPVAPSPTTQGWSETITGAGVVWPLSPDPNVPLNAWQINDSGAGLVRYTHGLSSVGQAPYEFELIMRPLAGQLYVEIVVGSFINDNSFYLTFDVVGTDLHLQAGPQGPIVFPNATDGYHSYRFISGWTWTYAYVFYDNALVGAKHYDSFANFNGPWMIFGTHDAAPGRVRIHHAHFGFLQNHHWGANYCQPALPNSTGTSGSISLYGSILHYQNNMQLRATNLPPNQFAYFLVSQTQGFAPAGQGNLCLGGSIGRFNQPGQIQFSGSPGSVALTLDTAAIPTPSGPVPMSAGQTWNFQCWYRDLNPGPTSNLTDGLEVALP